jgi:ATP phosphoribosyltransferase
MSKLKIAIQKNGRLSEKSLQLLKNCGISLSNGDRKLKSEASNFPLEVLFLRDDDIPKCVEEGVADIGIVGENQVLESKAIVNSILPLGFGACRLCLAIPREFEYQNLSYFQHKKIATSYPNILSQYLKESNIDAEIESISGSVEIAPGIGMADGIFDIVSTGSTLVMNGLKEVETVLKSQAVLIAGKAQQADTQKIIDKLLFRIKAVQAASSNKYILLNAPNVALDAITNVIPGMKSPTILPLAQEGWSSVHSVVSEDMFWESIDELQALGAQGILVIPIEKMIV